jgi:probable rRNA maturation factor
MTGKGGMTDIIRGLESTAIPTDDPCNVGRFIMTVSIKNHQKVYKVNLTRLRRSIIRMMKALHCLESEISILLLDDLQIQGINRTYLHRDRPTNVISFSMTEGECAAINPYILGDIIISVETALRDAEMGSIDCMDELEFLLIHGLLHLLGYDHENTTPEKVLEMKTKEGEIFYLLRHYPLESDTDLI